MFVSGRLTEKSSQNFEYFDNLERLGVYTDQDGDKWAIYYKMFTNRPIIDLCASSPRQYTHTATKRPVLIHTKNIQLANETPEVRYKRQGLG